MGRGGAARWRVPARRARSGARLPVRGRASGGVMGAGGGDGGAQAVVRWGGGGGWNLPARTGSPHAVPPRAGKWVICGGRAARVPNLKSSTAHLRRSVAR